MNRVLYTKGSWWIEYKSPSWFRKVRFFILGFQLWPKHTRINNHLTILGLSFCWYGKRTVKIWY
jgi:hypothetical protein